MNPEIIAPQSLFRPCIDLHNGAVKQIVGGTLGDGGAEGLRTNFVAEQPAEYFAGLYRRDRLSGGHVIKLGPGNDEAAKRALAAWRGGFHLGGGVTDRNAAEWLEAGAAKVIVTSFVFHDGELDTGNLDKLLGAVGRERLVLDLSCRKSPDGRYLVATDRWSRLTRYAVDGAGLKFLSSYTSEFLIHAVDCEGKLGGIDPELVDLLSDCSPLPCVYAGGVRNFDDIALIRSRGRGRIGYTIGSALDIFGGTLAYDEVAKAAFNPSSQR